MSVITLLTDFGTRDHFIGVVKGIILSINPSAEIVDITHEVRPHNIREGAFYLLSSYTYFPPGSIHLVVVDPGVGSKRRAIACKSKDYFFVAPDNGILSPVVEELEEVVALDREDFFHHPVSKTFHARDIFAPCSAYISKGIELKELGTPISRDELVTFPLKKPHFENDRAEGEVLHIDRFGNIITNFKVSEVLSWAGKEKIRVLLGKKVIKNWVNSYQEGGNDPFLIEGSSGYLEISLRNRNAAQSFKVKVESRVVIVKDFPLL